MPCHCGGTGTTEWGRFSSHRRRVEEKCIQAQRSLQGPRLLRRMGWLGRTSIFASRVPEKPPSRSFLSSALPFSLCFGLQTRLDGKRIDIEFALLRSKAGAGPADYATL